MTVVTVVRSGVRVAVTQVTGGAQVRVTGVGTQGPPGPVRPVGLALGWPMNGEDVTMFYAAFAVTVASLHAVIRGAGSVDLRVVRGARRDVADAVIGSVSVSDAGVGSEIVVADGLVPMGSYVWAVIDGVAGDQVREVHVTAWF